MSEKLQRVKYDHGALMSKYGLFGDGTYYEGEPEIFQYGKQLSLNWEPMLFRTRFTVPKDARPGDYFNLIMEVQDDAKKKITRYAQIIVTALLD
ncbi:hypothetical protein R2R35_11010 [Anaerocolumna sp. AGMB13020]|uniref:hypothetical protein n=1 Tax=Anaerocolumna sp. AGMB13020 TaxID=3081750 RepID=UPI002953D297|nr:hypothetical protein [Anaerocolumna sp. AGMB13020]WOO38983.1 hypothetical protein R2R35_11010 [Anaerocolumna sp. AGMB13020]